MPRPTNLVSFDEILDKEFGIKGSPKRQAFEALVEFARIGETSREARLAAGQSQQELGERLGIGKGQISKLENSIKDARMSTIERVFRALGIKPRLNLVMEEA